MHMHAFLYIYIYVYTRKVVNNIYKCIYALSKHIATQVTTLGLQLRV